MIHSHAILYFVVSSNTNETGMRRIALAKLWDQTTSLVSYQRLSEMALEYNDLSESKLHHVTVIYTDEEGDNITISTDDELTDAFEQFAMYDPPIVRAKVSFEVEKGLKQAASEIDATAKSTAKVDQTRIANGNDELQFLNEDEQDAFVQATQLLGSLLFQSGAISDMTEVMDEPIVVSEPSYMSSIPTDTPTITSRREISSVLLSHWDIELKQMHELGFLDDEKNVNALEHLQATNLHVDSTEPVTVNDAVNYLLLN